MAVDKILELDLSQLTEEGLALIDEQMGSVEDQLKKARKKTKPGKKLERERKQDKKTKDFIKKTATNPASFVISTLKTAIPQLSAILLATGVIINILKRINDIQSRFTENVDDRINIALSNQEQARVDANLQQIIITSGDGSANPRNVYNSFNESNANISLSESNYSLDNISGYN